ncbi:class E sortase [Streptomyces sp. CAU 1734]
MPDRWGGPGHPEPLPGPGRAERRRAAKGRGRGRKSPPPPQSAAVPAPAPPDPPRYRASGWDQGHDGPRQGHGGYEAHGEYQGHGGYEAHGEYQGHGGYEAHGEYQGHQEYQGHRDHWSHQDHQPYQRHQGPGGGEPPARRLTRVEARRAARAAKDSPAVVASRALGELFITFGLLMLLFVTYQLWWTNVRAGQEVDKETNKIQDAWAKGREPGAFKPGEGFAIMYIPKLDVVVPVAASIDKEKVLDRGMVGHYSEGRLKTAMPSEKTGNFAVAGHRNTHGEPFRYINRLKPGDPIVVETRDTYYTYEMASILPQTPPSNVAVIGPVPPGSGFTAPGRYITLTTCTPEFTSTYRMIVWGELTEERPRSKGKPDALVG